MIRFARWILEVGDDPSDGAPVTLDETLTHLERMPANEFDALYRGFLEHERRRRWLEERDELVRRHLDFAAWAFDMYGLDVELKTPAGAERDIEMLQELRKIHAGADKGRKRGHETRRARTAQEDMQLLAAVRLLENAEPRPATGEIIDALLSRYGPKYDPNDGDAFENARGALRKRIERAKRRREESPDT